MGVFSESIINALRLILTLDSEVISIAILSLKVTITAVVLSAMIAVPLAALLSFHKFFGKRIVVNIIHTMMGLPPVVVGLVVYLLLSRSGMLGGFELLYSPIAMILAQIVIVIPIITGTSMSAIESVSKVVKETAITLGSTKWQQILLMIKEARFAIVTSIVAGFGAAISEVGAIIIVGGNIRFHTRALTTAIILETRRGNFAMAMALGVILIVIAFIINMVLTNIQQKHINR